MRADGGRGVSPFRNSNFPAFHQTVRTTTYRFFPPYSHTVVGRYCTARVRIPTSTCPPLAWQEIHHMPQAGRPEQGWSAGGYSTLVDNCLEIATKKWGGRGTDVLYARTVPIFRHSRAKAMSDIIPVRFETAGQRLWVSGWVSLADMQKIRKKSRGNCLEFKHGQNRFQL